MPFSHCWIQSSVVFHKWEKSEILVCILCWSHQCFLHELDVTVKWRKISSVSFMNSCDRGKIWIVHHSQFHFNLGWWWWWCCFLDPSVLGILTNLSLPHPYIHPHIKLLLLYFSHLLTEVQFWESEHLLFSFRCCGNFTLAKKMESYTWQAMNVQIIFKRFVLKCKCSCNFKVLHIWNLKSSSNKSFEFHFKIFCKACQFFGSAFSTHSFH